MGKRRDRAKRLVRAAAAKKRREIRAWKLLGSPAADTTVYFPTGAYVVREGEMFNLDLGMSISAIQRR